MQIIMYAMDDDFTIVDYKPDSVIVISEQEYYKQLSTNQMNLAKILQYEKKIQELESKVQSTEHTLYKIEDQYQSEKKHNQNIIESLIPMLQLLLANNTLSTQIKAKILRLISIIKQTHPNEYEQLYTALMNNDKTHTVQYKLIEQNKELKKQIRYLSEQLTKQNES